MSDTDPHMDALVARFPRLFRGKHPEVLSTVPDGWAHLLGRMLADIDAMLVDGDARRFEILQIKEKFASLSVYWRLGRRRLTAVDLVMPDGVLKVKMPSRGAASAATRAVEEQISQRVRQAEQEAAATCQRCGKGDAKVIRHGWLVTLCAECEKQQAKASD